MNTNFINILKYLDSLTEGKDSYLKENENYIAAHQERVSIFADWLKEKLPELFDNIDIDLFDDLIKEHDASKWSEEEFEPYAQRWFGDKKKTLEYEEAWKHHWMHNEHHPEFWLGEDMPYIYILEMICDWGSFSVEKGDYQELIDFYYNKARDDEEKNLSDNTKIIIEEILDKIKIVIEQEEDI